MVVVVAAVDVSAGIVPSAAASLFTTFPSEMVVHIFSLLGDSNVGRFVSLTNRRACVELKDAQVLSCGKLPLLAERLREVRQESTIVIVACLTNFLADSISSESTSTSASVRVETNLLAAQEVIVQACSDRSDCSFMICPPMYRVSPLWYRDGLSEILGKFSSVFATEKPSNLHLMPSFSSPSFETDGIHLTPSSGLEYLFHLFDSAKTLLQNHCLELPLRSSLGYEATRVLEDRVMALEQDHRRLSKSVEYSAAISAEREDFQENVRNEVFFMISGLTPIQGLRGRDWMARAIIDVQNVIKILLGKELKIIVVHNATGRATGSEVRYSVRMENAAFSQEIRSKFGTFFVGGQDRRPEALRSISISNKVTPGTQIRILILKLLARRYVTTNPGSTAKVIGYEPRPLLKITPPESVSSRVKIYTYIEAISKLPTCFASSEVQPIISKARVHFKGILRSTFVVLNDDDARLPPAARIQDLPDGDDPNRQSSGSGGSAGSGGTSGPQVSRKRPPPAAGSVPDSQRARF